MATFIFGISFGVTVISVERSGKEIGDYNLEGVKEGLGSGYFLSSDYGWYAGLTEWHLLPEIVEMLSSQADLTPALSPAEPVSPKATITTSNTASTFTLFRGRGPAKATQVAGAAYFYRSPDQKANGPLNKLEMRGLIRKKIVEPETMVLCPVAQEWLPCDRFPELPKPAYNKLLHFEKDTRFASLIQEIPKKIVEHISNEIDETKLATWLIDRIKECGYRCPDWDEGTINDLVSDDRIEMIIRTNRQSWVGYLQYRYAGGNALANKPVLIAF